MGREAHETGLRDKHGHEIFDNALLLYRSANLLGRGTWRKDLKGWVNRVQWICEGSSAYCGFGFDDHTPLTPHKATRVEVVYE